MAAVARKAVRNARRGGTRLFPLNHLPAIITFVRNEIWSGVFFRTARPRIALRSFLVCLSKEPKMSRWCKGCLSVSVICALALTVGDAIAQPAGEDPELGVTALRLYVIDTCAAPNVQKELKLSDEQMAVMAEVRNRLIDAGALRGEGEKVRQALDDAAKTIRAALSPEQEKRLKQLHLQRLGASAIRLPETVATLGITGEQQQKLQAIGSKETGQLRALEKNFELPLSELDAKSRLIREEARSASLAVLTPAQREKFEEMKGPAFDFSVRVAPVAAYFGRGGPRKVIRRYVAPSGTRSSEKVPSANGAAGQSAKAAEMPAKIPTGNDIDDTAGTLRLLVQRWKDNQDRLHAGVVRFHGRKLETSSKLPRIEGPDNGLCAFDFPGGLFRFDRSSPRRESVPQIAPGSGKIETRPAQAMFDAKWISAPDKTVSWIEGRHIMDIRNAGMGPSSDLLKWFDVRTLGLDTELILRPGNSPDYLFERFSSRDRPTLVSEEKGVYRIVWIYGGWRQRLMLWLDGNTGFTPLRMEVGERSKDGSKWLAPEFETTATWQRISDVWVVKTFSLRETERDGGTHQLDLSFDWESVNAAVPASYFAIESIETKPGDRMIDSRWGKPLIFHEIGNRWAAPLDAQPLISAVPSARSIKTTLTPEMARLVESMAESASSTRTGAHQLRVAVFCMKGGDPGNSLVKLLESKLQCRCRTVTAEEIRAGALKNFDVVLFPGGGGVRQAKELQDEGQKAVRQFVQEGGGYVGICAGAYLASCKESLSLNLIIVTPLTGTIAVPGPEGVTSINMAARGGGIVKVELTDAGSKILGQRSGLLDVSSGGGPVFHAAGRKDLPECVSLAVYRTEVWLYEPQRGTMVDTPAILAAPFGKGRVIVFSPHPESSNPNVSPGLESFVTRAVLAVARKPR